MDSSLVTVSAVSAVFSLLGIFCTATGVVDLAIRKGHGWGIFPTRAVSWAYILGGATVAVSGVFRLVQMGVR